MKRFKINYLMAFLFTLLFLGCENVLDTVPKSELSSETFLSTESGINTVLNDAYKSIHVGAQHYMHKVAWSLLSSQIGYGRAGLYEQDTGIPAGNFVWNSNNRHFRLWWTAYYEGIRDANIVLDRLESGEYSEGFRNNKMAEAKALRGYLYYQLYKLFGPVPIITTSTPDELENPRASEDEMRTRIEQDLSEAAAVLPIQQEQFGQVTKGAALGMLTKFYLNTKQWQKTIDTAEEVRSLGVYNLVPDFGNIYSHDNEGNEEVVWVVPQLSTQRPSTITGIIHPPGYPLPEGQRTFAAHTYAYDWFMDSFPDNDTRRDLIVTEYVNTSGEHVQGYGNDQSIWFKYPQDPNAQGVDNGIDFMAVRYADILLSLAEARNELDGPNQESIDLINEIRNRAGADEVQVGNFASKEELRDHILNERLWEFYFEGMERIDLLRHGKFISNAQERGVNAQDYHRLFPIPQSEVDANSQIEQNPGY